MERSFGKEIKFYYENKMKKVSGCLKNYWYEILLFLIFIWLTVFVHSAHWMFPTVLIRCIITAFFLWFANIRKYKLLYPLIMVLILIIPAWIITKYFPMFYILEVLPISYIVFSITSFIQIIEFLIKNKFSKKKQRISRTYIICNGVIFLASVLLLYLSSRGLL